MRGELSVRMWGVLCGVLLLCGACQEQAPVAPPAPIDAVEPPVEPPPSREEKLRVVYVPAYSHLPKGSAAAQEEGKSLLSILLSVRNVDSAAVITLSHVDYFDTAGHRVRRYLSEPRKLRPLETAEFSVPIRDEVGGSGANFLVYWEGPADAHPLLTEAVMYGYLGNGYVSFTSRGIELDRRPETVQFEREPSAPAQAPAPSEALPDMGAMAGD